MIKILIVKIENNYTRLIFINKKLKKVMFLEEKIILSGVKDFYSITSREEYIKSIIDIIGGENKFNKVFFVVQNEDVIIRDYKGICNMKKKDIPGYINFEVCQDMPINLEEYELKYKLLNKEKYSMDLQVILFPKIIKKTCLEIVKGIKVKKYYLNMKFDILQKLIGLKVICPYENKYFLIENLLDQIVLNYVESDVIQSSNILEKEFSEEYVSNFIEEDINIFYYGEEDLFLEKLISNKKKVDKLKLNLNKKYLWINEIVDKYIDDYVLEVGEIL